MEGIDISSFQVGLDMAKVKAAGKEFVLLKVSEGTDWTYDFSALETGAHTNGLVVGKYHYGRPDTNTSTSDVRAITLDATLEAEWFLTAGKPVEGDMIALDLEQQTSLSPAQMEVWVATWLSVVENVLGQIPLLYTNPNYWATEMGGTKEFGAYPLWLAEWGANDGTRQAPTVYPAGWTSFAIHQYTSKGTITGWSGSLDFNYINPNFEYTTLQIGQQPTVTGDPYGAPWSVVSGGQVVAKSTTRTTAFTDKLFSDASANGQTILKATRRTA